MMMSAPRPRIIYACALPMHKQDGPALHVQAIVSRMVKQGHPVTLLQSGAYALDGVDVVDIGGSSGGIFHGAAMRRGLTIALKRELAQAPAQAVYMRGSFPSAVKAAQRAGVPAILEYNGILDAEMRIAGVPALRRWLQLRREAAAARGCTAAVAVDDATKDGMVQLYPELRNKCVTILNGSDVEAFAPHMAGSASRRDMRKLVFVGGFHPWTRIDIALRAFALLPREWTFDIIGDGAPRSEYEALARELGTEERVTFHGRQPHANIPPLLTAAAVGVCIEDAGFAGSAPLKFGEYLAAGCAVVVNGYDCHRALERMQFAALFENPPTPEGAAEAIVRLAKSGALTEELALARHAYAAQHLGWTRTTREILEFIDQVAGGDFPRSPQK